MITNVPITFIPKIYNDTMTSENVSFSDDHTFVHFTLLSLTRRCVCVCLKEHI